MKRKEKITWWQEALLATLTGAILSVVISLAITVGSTAGLEPFKTIERLGADFGMRAMWSFRVDDSVEDQAYIFVDVDTNACTLFHQEMPHDLAVEACLTGRSIPAPLIAEVIDAASKSHAAVVVLDVAPYDANEEEPISAAIDKIGAAPSPYFLLPQAGRPAIDADSGKGIFNRAPTVFSRLGTSASALRLVSVQFDDDSAGDGLVRRFDRTTNTAGIGEVPTAPWLSALLMSRATAAAADCLYYHRQCDRVSPEERNALADTERNQLSGPTVFSLPSLAIGADEVKRQSPIEQERWGESETWFSDHLHYKRLVASEMLSEGHGHFPPSRFEPGALVVVGSSAPSAIDRYQTPVGTMTGGELILNAARAFNHQLRRGEETGSNLTPAVEKARAIGLGSLVMLVVWLIIYFFLHRRAHRTTFWQRFMTGSTCSLIFVVGFVLIALLELRFQVEPLRRSLGGAQPVDLLTPIVALGLEGYAEAARTAFNKTEQFLLWIGRAIASLFKKKPPAKASRVVVGDTSESEAVHDVEG